MSPFSIDEHHTPCVKLGIEGNMTQLMWLQSIQYILWPVKMSILIGTNRCEITQTVTLIPAFPIHLIFWVRLRSQAVKRVFNRLMNRHLGEAPPIPTWAWHGHNGHATSAGGALATWHMGYIHTWQMVHIGPQRGAQLKNPKSRLSANVHIVSKASTYNRYWIIEWNPLAVSSHRTTYWDCVYVQVSRQMTFHCHCSTVPASAEVDEPTGFIWMNICWLVAVALFLHAQEGITSGGEREVCRMLTSHKSNQAARHNRKVWEKGRILTGNIQCSWCPLPVVSLTAAASRWRPEWVNHNAEHNRSSSCLLSSTSCC